MMNLRFRCLCYFLVFFLSSLAEMSHFRVSTLNLNGARDVKKRISVFELMNLKHINVLMVQETHSDSLNEIDWRREWGGEIILSHLNQASGGVAILFSKNFLPVSYHFEEVVKGRLMVVKAKYECFNIVFVNVYAPNTRVGRINLLHEIEDVLSKCDTDDFLFLGGDFNCTENDQLDRNHLEPHPASTMFLKHLVDLFSLVDIWREMHGHEIQYTWARNTDASFSAARLDRIYSFRHNFGIFQNCSIHPVSFSDHALVSCNAFIANIKHKSAYWHFNTALLLDAHFRDVFVSFWKMHKTRKDDFASLRQWWDRGKIEIKELCQQYTVNVSSNLTKSIRDLEIEIVELQVSAHSTGNRGDLENLNLKKAALADLLGSRTQGAMVRCRFQKVTLMDAPTKFFFSLEKKQGQCKFMHGLKSSEDVLLTTDGDIRKRAAEFYADLYSSEYVEDDDNFNDFCSDLPRVSEDVAKELGEPMTLEEIHAALRSMDGGKAPGIDGLPSEFYRAFWSVLCIDLLEVFEESFAVGSLPQSCRRAVLTLLPKKGDLQEIKNWRPVSLLCTDYKLLSKVLANRLKKVMDQVVHQTQTYCVPGRSMFDNISLVRDILDVSSFLGYNAGLVSLDQEKAFDRVEHRYLWKVLERFGLDFGFIAKIMVLYENIESVLKINGCLCKPFKVTRGIRQGCSLSGMLYALSIEPLLRKIRLNIEGLVFPSCNVSFTLSAYADDVIIMVKNQEEVNNLSRIVESFCKLSSARVNWAKSEALAIGSWLSGLPRLPGGLKWRRGGLKYLGVHLGDEDTEKMNWEGVMEKVEERLSKWRWLLRQISYRGRVLILNNLIASLLWHKLACLEPPAGLLNKIQSCMIKFFWDDKHWVPQAVLFLPKEEGGQGLVHLESRTAAFRLQFIQKYLMGREEDVLWKPITSIILRRIGSFGLDASLFLLNCKSLFLYEMPVFYKSLFRAWTLFEWKRLEPTASLFWLLEEPLIFEARLALEDGVGVSRRLLQNKVLKFGHIVKTAGPGLKNTEATAHLLGLKSIRVMRTILDQWLGKLTLGEKQFLEDLSNGEDFPNSTDPFPEMGLNIDFSDLTGPLLITQRDFNFCMLNGKCLYKLVVQGLKKKHLSGRTDTVWRAKFKVGDSRKPIWRVFYKAPLSKRVGDLQWRILHGAIGVNSFVVKFRKDMSELCPFCEEIETVFHMFLECKRLSPLFMLLENVFKKCGVYWSDIAFIFGAGYTKKESSKWNLLNFLIGQAKLSIYVDRKNKVNGGQGERVDKIFILLVKSRVKAEFMFFSMMNNLIDFVLLWCFNNVVCSVVDEELVFSSIFV